MSNSKILVLWGELPGYLAACLRTLLADYNVPVFIIVTQSHRHALHMTLQKFSGFRYLDLSSPDAPEGSEVRRMIVDYGPAITVAGCPKWGVLPRLARTAKDCGSLMIWATDHPWQGSWRDYANSILARLGVVYTGYDAAWVPGHQGRLYAHAIGFPENRIFPNVLSCDTDKFRPVGIARFHPGASRQWPRVFLFLGRYVPCKDIATLIKAYAAYRELCTDPWDLWFAGDGPLSSLIPESAGVRNMGYQSPAGCASLMRQAGTLILPSRWDHWGVVIHEGACAGLPVLASHGCGAVADLVRDGYNGYAFPVGDVVSLARLMHQVSASGHAEEMGRNSLNMSYQFSPQLWAQTLLIDLPFRLFGQPLVMEEVYVSSSGQ